MISTVIQSAIDNSGYNGCALNALNDSTPFPFVVHEEKGIPAPLTKDQAAGGVRSYTWQVQVGIFAKTPDEVETIVAVIDPAIMALRETTQGSTVINGITYEGETPDYDEELDAFYSMLDYEINTKTR